MAKEETNSEEGQVDDKTSESEESAGSTEEQTSTETETTPSEAEQKLTEEKAELQSKFDTLSQDSEKNTQLLNELSPYVDWDGMKKVRAGGKPDDDALDDETGETFITQKEAKALEQRINQKIATSDFQRDFRKEHPDLGDGGPKEDMVRFFYEKKTNPRDPFDKRVKSAAQQTRDFLKSEQDKGASKTKADEEKAKKEAKDKEEAAAKASGLSSAGTTSPKKSNDDNEEETRSDYVDNRKARLNKLKTHT